MRKMNLLFLFLVIISFAHAQSIGVTPGKTIETEANTPTEAYFSVSQGSNHPEKITIEGYYDWLTIEERDFILESKTGKSIKMIIDVKKPGTYEASLKICGSEITSEGETLAAKACANHELNVIAKGKNRKYLILPIVIIALVVGIYYFVKIIKDDFKKK